MITLRRRDSLPLVLWLCIGALSCGGGDGGGTGPAPVASVTVTPPSASVNEFDSLQLTATPKDAGGAPLSGRVITWSTNVNKATVTSSGMVHPFLPGPITVVATSEGVSGSSAITIVVPVKVVLLTPNAVTLNVGDTARLTPGLLGPAGDPPTDSTLTWTSSDAAIATVVGGLVSAKAAGSATIKATATDGTFGTATIGVLPSVASISVTPTSDTVLADSSTTFTAVTKDAAGNPLGRAVAWSSSDTLIARVTPFGTATGRSAGSVFITAVSEGKRDSASLLVIRASVALLQLSVDTVTVMVGSQRQLSAQTFDSVGNPLNRPLVWLTSDPSRATVTAAGLVTTLDTGLVSIAASSEGVGDTATFSVTHIAGRFTQLAMGGTHECALTDQQRAYCWGKGDYGGLGDSLGTRTCGPSNDACADAPIRVAGGLSFTSLVSGDAHTCGLTAAGAVYCWGSDVFDQLGGAGSAACNSSTIQGPCRFSPGLISGNLTFTAITAGTYFNCGLAADSTAFCWGANDYFQLGGDSLNLMPHQTPIPVYGGRKFVAIAAGQRHVCALDPAAAAWCWGWGLEGELGDDLTSYSTVPVAVHGGLTFVQLVAGYFHTCGLTTSGQAYCWGSNGYGMLGDGTTNISLHPNPVAGGHTYSALSAGAWNGCGIVAPGTAYCWGLDDFGQLGSGVSNTNGLSPVPIPGGLSYGATSNALYTVCGLTTGGAAYCWGGNGIGQAGVGFVDPTTLIIVGPARVAGQP